MAVTTADEALRLYFHYRDGGHALRSVELCDSRLVCARCKGGPRTEIVERARDGSRRERRRQVCVSCGAKWQGTRKGWVRDRVQAPRSKGRMEHHVDVWRHVRAMVEPTPQGYDDRGWERMLGLLEAHLSPYLGSYPAVAEWAERQWPDEGPWRPWTVGRMLRRARGVIEGRLVRRAA